jgi:hypothetical protein
MEEMRSSTVQCTVGVPGMEQAAPVKRLTTAFRCQIHIHGIDVHSMHTENPTVTKR